jgi:anti-sigma B factor antagonist
MEASQPTTSVTPFDITVSGPPSRPVVTVKGEIDVATSPRLRTELTALVARGAEDLTIQFGGVTFVDSSGLGVLVAIYKRLREDGKGRVHIVDAQPPVRKVFEITGLESALLDG